METFQLLMCLKLKYPQSITLLRGNHESRQITSIYGFYDEALRKYGNANPWKYCCEVFDYLCIAAVVDEEIFCIHGGLSPDIRTVDAIKLFERRIEIPPAGPYCDLMWSDPEDIESWAISPRGAGWLFGRQVTREFLHINQLQLIIRAHQLVNLGYKYWFGPEETVLTIWSAPNYCYRCGNDAALVTINE